MEKKMNKKWLTHIIAAGTLAVFIVLGLASVTTDAATKKFKNAEEAKEYLASQEENKPDKPIEIVVPADDSTLKDILDAIKSAGKYVFLDLSDSTLTTIPPNAFKDNTFITGIRLRVTDIKDNAFSGCPNLTFVGLVKVANISNNAFHNCPKLIWIGVSESNQKYSSEIIEDKKNGVSYCLLYNKDKTLLIRCPEGYKGDIYVGSREVGPYAFYGSGITNVTFRGGGFNLSTYSFNIQKVYENAFVNCTNLTSVTFDGNTEISKDSFDGDLFEQWDKATTETGLRNVGFKGTFTRINGTSTKWTRK